MVAGGLIFNQNRSTFGPKNKIKSSINSRYSSLMIFSCSLDSQNCSNASISQFLKCAFTIYIYIYIYIYVWVQKKLETCMAFGWPGPHVKFGPHYLLFFFSNKSMGLKKKGQSAISRMFLKGKTAIWINLNAGQKKHYIEL